MTTPPDRLVAALTDRYAIERELGEGGMVCRRPSRPRGLYVTLLQMTVK